MAPPRSHGSFFSAVTRGNEGLLNQRKQREMEVCLQMMRKKQGREFWFCPPVDVLPVCKAARWDGDLVTQRHNELLSALLLRHRDVTGPRLQQLCGWPGALPGLCQQRQGALCVQEPAGSGQGGRAGSGQISVGTRGTSSSSPPSAPASQRWSWWLLVLCPPEAMLTPCPCC